MVATVAREIAAPNLEARAAAARASS
jgi:hypothetical protein